MDKHFPPSLQSVFYEAVSQSEELFRIFLGAVPKVDVQVFEVLATLGVLLAGYVENVGDAQLK